ncbi:MAG: hypothetical protein KDB00_07035, partial [Planctomycetales bacterium]|nr:hypothetical protein [Planctomycetales bacterium]
YIVTAAAPVSIGQLAKLTGMGDQVDVSVFELVNQRLVIDDATGQECITVVHDRIADGLIKNLGRQQLQQAHLAWAGLLSDLNRPRDFAARIAGHYYAAGQEGAALPFAMMAAENADRAFAKSEAGEWHEKVLRQVVGDARDKHLHDAARCFREADLPEKAAHYYLVLAERATQRQDYLRFQTLAIQLLVRSGQLERARPLIVELAGEFGINFDGNAGEATLGYRLKLASLAGKLSEVDVHDLQMAILSSAVQNDTVGDCGSSCELHFCSEISRSLSMLDFRSTMRLVLHGGIRAFEQGTPEDRIHFGTMANVWTAVLSGRQTKFLDESRKSLVDMRDRLLTHPANKVTAEIQSGIAFVETLAMNWAAVPDAVDSCVVDFIADSRPMRFEIAHTRWLRLWADWHLGRWDKMRAMAYEMVDDASRRNDSYQQLVATTGFGGNAFLFSDSLDELRRLCDENNRIVTDTGTVELIHFFQWMQSVQQSLYAGDFDAASRHVITMRQSIGKSLVRRIPLVQVSLDFMTALSALHLRQQDSMPQTPPKRRRPHPLGKRTIVQNSIRRLDHQSSQYGKLLAALLRGIDLRIRSRRQGAAFAFQRAAELASEQGLFPYQLAAEDGLMNARNHKADADSVRQQMLNHRIAFPEKLERLYTVAPVGQQEPDL